MDKVTEQLYAQCAQYGVHVNLDIFGSTHPLCFAAWFFPEDAIQNSVKFAKAYLSATCTQKNRGIPRNSNSADPECIYHETLLESLVKSGRCDIMKLLIKQGANVNALSREGRSLLDIAEGDMYTLLKGNGAEPGDQRDYLLHMSFLGINHQWPERLEYIAQLVEIDPHYTYSINFETTDLSNYWSIDLLTEAIAFCDIEALQLLLPISKGRLCGHQAVAALKRAVRYCINDIFSVNCGKLARMLQLFEENGVWFLYEIDQQIFVLQAVQDLICYNRLAKLHEDDTVIDVCYLLCKLFRVHPVNIYHKALANVSRQDWGEAIPSKALLKDLFILRGWKVRPLKKRK